MRARKGPPVWDLVERYVAARKDRAGGAQSDSVKISACLAGFAIYIHEIRM